MRPSPRADQRTLRIVHLFPDLLNTYGDSGNVQTLVVRAERRGIRTTVTLVLDDSTSVPDGDVFLIGGGQDRDQVRVEAALGRLGDHLEHRISDGATLLAVCGGFQNLGRRYRFADGRTVHGPGLFAAETIAGPDRLVGPVVTRLTELAATRIAAGSLPQRETVVGFENHSGRTYLDDPGDAFAIPEVGSGNNGTDRTEGYLAVSDVGDGAGLRIGTYLHGPILPRNPHVADALIRSGLARTGQFSDLDRLDDSEDWLAHDGFVARTRPSWFDRAPGRRTATRLRRLLDPLR